MRILHLFNIYLFSSDKLESLDKTLRRVCHLLRFLQVGEYFLELNKNIIRDWFIEVYYWKTKLLNHVKLLNQTVHVAGASKVLKTDVTNFRFCLSLVYEILTYCIAFEYLANFFLKLLQQTHQLRKVTLIVTG
jgi:uncharacterized membrane protein YwzB